MNASKLFLFQSFLYKFETAVIVVGEIVNLILLQDSFHDIEKLFFARIIDFFEFALDLMEPVLNGVELWRVGGKVEHVDAVLFG
jgi:hypothetical protein